ncbi:hypothetical protein AB4Z18_17805 [Leifsonia sp. 2TAF2]|uniref:hypothetical protein n=1 Tax=Leifsonia sp. 2TAF2 TaxID=3233009 RepID=UPI003F9E34DA
MAKSTAGRRIRLRVAGVLSLILGLGFGIPAAVGAWYFGTHGQVWQFLGNPTNGDGPFVEWGVPNSVALMVAFAVVCAADVLCGALLLASSRVGVVLSVVLLPVELVFWIGFLLPFAFPLGVARVVLVLWPSSSPDSPQDAAVR